MNMWNDISLMVTITGLSTCVSGCSLNMQWLAQGNLDVLANLEVECLEPYFSKALELEVALALPERLVKTQNLESPPRKSRAGLSTSHRISDLQLQVAMALNLVCTHLTSIVRLVSTLVT